ncbi:hypothetical protein Taro_031506, partial [Colocasia esculenta]|nr:hypothetical protein [Colocasia esculenta]
CPVHCGRPIKARLDRLFPTASTGAKFVGGGRTKRLGNWLGFPVCYYSAAKPTSDILQIASSLLPRVFLQPRVSLCTVSSFGACCAMTETDSAVGILSASGILEQLGKAFIELKSNSEGSTSYGIMWEEVKEHFTNLESSLNEKLEELEEKEKALEEKASASRGLVFGREAEVATKEQAYVDRIQELKDAAVAAIAEARKKYKVPSPEPADIVGDKQTKVSSSVNGDNNKSFPGTEEKSPDNRSGGIAEAIAAEVKPQPQLVNFCEQMDAKGLLSFLYENRKSLNTIREQVPIALKSASDPAHFVLESLEGFYPPDKDQPTHDGHEDTALMVLRRTCVVLMEAAAPLLGVTEPSGDQPLSSENKQQAKAIADEWNSKLDGVDIDAANGNSLEAHAFLQLLATFNIAPEFDEDKLCKYILAVSRRRQAPELCRSLGLTHKVPGVVEALISSGRLIDAVHFIHAFQLTESFPPVPLLKDYLLANSSKEKSGHDGASGAQLVIILSYNELLIVSPPMIKDAGALELGALRAVLRCIEEYNLQTEYPPSPLRKRVAELEKAKADKKRTVGATKFHGKKPRGTGGYTPRAPPVHADYRQDYRQAQPRAFDERGLHAGSSE